MKMAPTGRKHTCPHSDVTKLCDVDSHVSGTGASTPRGNDAFCVIANVGGKLKDAATRCVLRPVDA